MRSTRTGPVDLYMPGYNMLRDKAQSSTSPQTNRLP